MKIDSSNPLMFEKTLSEANFEEISDFVTLCDQKTLQYIKSNQSTLLIDFVKDLRNQAEKQAKQLFKESMK